MLTMSESCASTPCLCCHLQPFLHSTGSSSISQRKWLGLTGLRHSPVISTITHPQVCSPNHHATLSFSILCLRLLAWNGVHSCLLRNITVCHIKRESLHWFLYRKQTELVGQGGIICTPLLGSWMCVGWLAVTSRIRLLGPREGTVPKPFITHDTDIFPGSNCVLAGEWSEAPEISFVWGPFSL